MTEKLRPDQQEQSGIRKLEVSEVFKPFEELTAFPVIELDHTKRINLYEIPIEFNGVRGKLSLLTDPGAEDLTATDTPLGKVRLVKSFEGNDYTIDEMPLGIELNFEITTMDQHRRLNKHTMEFDLGGKKYYLRCGGVDHVNAVEESIKEEGEMELWDSDLIPEEKKEGTVLLPYDPSKLAIIEARIVEKEIPLIWD